MEKRTMFLCCTMAFSFWLFALAYASGRPPEVKMPAETQGAMSVSAMPTGAEIALPEMPTLPVSCQAAILVEQHSGTVLYEYQADDSRAVASITKVMTLLLTFEAIDEGKIALTDTVPISSHAYEMGGSQIWLEPGEVFTLEELLKAVCVSSANDAAVAIAEYVGGSEQGFVAMMNERAAELGMTNTTYQNACGLDQENHVSSARDVAILSCYILEHHPEVLEYTGIWTDTLRDGTTALTNTNKLLRYYDGITGLKTGTTGHAGICISASATRGDLSLIAVVLGSASSKERFHSAMTMLDYGFATFEAAAVPPCAQIPEGLFVKGGVVEQMPLDLSAVPQTLLLEKGGGKGLSSAVVLQEKLFAPVAKGSEIGHVQISCEGQLLAEYPVLAGQTIEKLTTKGAMKLLLQNLCVG